MVYHKQKIAKVCARPECNKPFEGNNKQKYCSVDCAAKMQKKQLAALTQRRRQAKSQSVCPHCGKPLLSRASSPTSNPPPSDLHNPG
jgi:hypothetical protein